MYYWSMMMVKQPMQQQNNSGGQLPKIPSSNAMLALVSMQNMKMLKRKARRQAYQISICNLAKIKVPEDNRITITNANWQLMVDKYFCFKTLN